VPNTDHHYIICRLFDDFPTKNASAKYAQKEFRLALIHQHTQAHNCWLWSLSWQHYGTKHRHHGRSKSTEHHRLGTPSV